MLHHDDRQAALHLQDESEHTMGQGTLSSEAVQLQNSLLFLKFNRLPTAIGWTLDFFAFVCFCVGQVYCLILCCRLGCSKTKGLNLRKGCWLIHGECTQCGGKLCGHGDACHHLLGWTLAEELLTMLLKEWSGKKDLPKTCHPTPKEGKVFQSQLS